MNTGVRIVAMVLVLSLLAGPLAPYAGAQQPAPQPAQQPVMMQEPVPVEKSGDGVYVVGATVFNVFYVPGKVVVCTLGGGAALVVLLITLGSGYRAAAGTIREGCGGRWVLKADDLKPDPTEPPPGSSY